MRFIQFFHGKKSGTPSEEQLLKSYRESEDLRLLGTLFQPYMDQLFSVCYKLLGDEDESKDAVMQIFEKLISDLKTHEVTQFKYWLHRVARNHCLMQLRAKSLFISGEFKDVADAETGMGFSFSDEGPLFSDGQIGALEHCLCKLSPDQRRVVELFYMQEKCYREISDDTGLSYNQVKSYIQNGKRNLKICMDKNGKV